MNLVFSSSGQYAYTMNADQSIGQFEVSRDGSWSALTPSTVSAIGCDGPMSMNKASGGGEYLYALSCRQNEVLVYAMSNSGLLTQQSTASTGDSPQALTIFQDNLYVTNTNGNSVSMFKIESNGNLSPMNPSSIQAGQMPEVVGVDKNGKVAYLLDYLSNDITLYKVNSNGELQVDSATAVSTGDFPAQILFKY